MNVRLSVNTTVACLGLAVMLVAVGCETTDYEPLRVKRKLKELEADVGELRQQNAVLKNELERLTGNKIQFPKTGAAGSPASGSVDALPAVLQAQSARVSNSTAVSVSPLSTNPPTVPALYQTAETEVCNRWESKGAYFVRGDQGLAVEADLTECQPADVNQAVQQIQGFSKLKRVSFAGNHVDDATFELLRQMPNIQRLDLPNSNPSVAAMRILAAMPRLSFLQLKTATLNVEKMTALSASKSLQQIRVAQTRLGDQELAPLANLTTLQAIDLSSCNRVTAAGVKSLARCRKLKFLKLFGEDINDNTMDTVAQIKTLRVLGLNDTAVTDQGIQKLAGLDLVELQLFRTSIGDQGLAVIAGMPNLKTLNLRDTRVSDAGVEQLVGCQSLRKIDLSECNSPGVTDLACASLAEISTLVDVNMWKTGISDAGVAKLTALPQLARLNLDDTRVGDAATEAIGQLENLTWLHLGKTAITDTSVGILEKMKQLKFLDISNTPNLSKDAQYDIADALEPSGCYINF